MTGDALAEMEHKHVLDTICRINGRQPAWMWVRGLKGVRGRDGEGKKEGKWEVREGLSFSHYGTGVFKYHHRVWLRHESWESSVDQRLFKWLFLFLFHFFFFSFSTVTLFFFFLAAESLAQRGSFETMKGEINPNEMLITHLKKKVCHLPAEMLFDFCCGILPFVFFHFQIRRVSLWENSGNVWFLLDLAKNSVYQTWCLVTDVRSLIFYLRAGQKTCSAILFYLPLGFSCH